MKISITFLLALLASMAFASTASAASKDCVPVVGKWACVLEYNPQPQAVMELAGANFTSIAGVEFTFTDGSSKIYYSPQSGKANASGQVLSWGGQTQIQRTSVDSYDGSNATAVKQKLYQDLGFAGNASTVSNLGQKIVISDSLNGGKTIASVSIYADPAGNLRQNLTPAVTYSWTVLVDKIESVGSNRIRLESSAGGFDRGVNGSSPEYITFKCGAPGTVSGNANFRNSPCAGLFVDGTTSTDIRFKRPRLSTTSLAYSNTATTHVVSWTDNAVVLESERFSGGILRQIEMQRGKQLTNYVVAPALAFPLYVDKVTTAAGGKLTMTGSSFANVDRVIVEREDGALHQYDKNNPGLVMTDGSLAITDPTLAGRTVTKVHFYYTSPDTNQLTKYAISWTGRVYLVGSISGAVSSSSGSVTINGEGLQAVVSVVFGFDDGSSWTWSGAENTGSFTALTITSDQLAGKTINNITATAYDGQKLTAPAGTQVYVLAKLDSAVATPSKANSLTLTGLGLASLASITVNYDGGSVTIANDGSWTDSSITLTSAQLSGKLITSLVMSSHGTNQTAQLNPAVQIAAPTPAPATKGPGYGRVLYEQYVWEANGSFSSVYSVHHLMNADGTGDIALPVIDLGPLADGAVSRQQGMIEGKMSPDGRYVMSFVSAADRGAEQCVDYGWGQPYCYSPQITAHEGIVILDLTTMQYQPMVAEGYIRFEQFGWSRDGKHALVNRPSKYDYQTGTITTGKLLVYDVGQAKIVTQIDVAQGSQVTRPSLTENGTLTYLQSSWSEYYGKIKQIKLGSDMQPLGSAAVLAQYLSPYTQVILTPQDTLIFSSWNGPQVMNLDGTGRANLLGDASCVLPMPSWGAGSYIRCDMNFMQLSPDGTKVMFSTSSYVYGTHYFTIGDAPTITYYDQERYALDCQPVLIDDGEGGYYADYSACPIETYQVAIEQVIPKTLPDSTYLGGTWATDSTIVYNADTVLRAFDMPTSTTTDIKTMARNSLHLMPSGWN